MLECPFPFIVLAQHHTSCLPLGMQLNFFPDSRRLTPDLERERYALCSTYDIPRAPSCLTFHLSAQHTIPHSCGELYELSFYSETLIRACNLQLHTWYKHAKNPPEMGYSIK